MVITTMEEFPDSRPSTPVIPHNREAEEAVIGSVLINPQTFCDLENELSADDFYIVRHRWIWECFGRLRKARTPIDLLTVSEDLAREGHLTGADGIGGESYLTELLQKTPTSLNAEAYAKMVLADATRRAYLTYANQIAKVAYDKAAPDDIDEKFRAIIKPEAKGHGNVLQVEDVGLALQTKINDPSPQAIPCHVIMQDASGQDYIYGLPSMTRDLGGLPYGDAIILAAPTQTGKTTFAYQLAEIAAFQNLKAHYVSTESTAQALMLKRAMANLGISFKLMRRGELTDLQKQDISDEINRLIGFYSGLLSFDDRSHTVQAILRGVARVKPDLLVVDHLGELSYTNQNKTIGIEENFTEIRRYCHGEGIAFLCVHMIDIAVTTRPQLSDLRWARGGLSEKTDMALMMYRPDLTSVRDGDESKLQESLLSRKLPVPVEIWERKDRGGPVDVLIETEYDLAKQIFQTPVMQTI